MIAKMCSGYLNTQIYQLSEIILILLTISPTFAGYGWPREGQPWMNQPLLTPANTTEEPPVFELTSGTSGLTGIVDQTVLLPCVVRHLGDKVVSWIRTRDLHILTSGIHIFTSDNRFEVVHNQNSDFWGLKIKKSQLTDSGKYECQVNTDPKINNAILLKITDLHMHDSPMEDSRNNLIRGLNDVVMIHGSKEQYVRAGSTITFTCVISRTRIPLGMPRVLTLKWTHGGRDVTFQSSRGGISVDTDYRDEHITSRLTVAMVTNADIGAYTCDAGNHFKSATVHLYIFEGERLEAMQRDLPNGDDSSRNLNSSILPFFFIYFNWIVR